MFLLPFEVEVINDSNGNISNHTFGVLGSIPAYRYYSGGSSGTGDAANQAGDIKRGTHGYGLRKRRGRREQSDYASSTGENRARPNQETSEEIRSSHERQ